MANVLYADYQNNTKYLSDKLRYNHIEVDCIGNQVRGNKIVLANDIFWDEYAKRLGEYEVLIAHLGVGFNAIAQQFINEFPKLSVVIVSSMPRDYSESRGRFLVCDYRDEQLVPFVIAALAR